MSLLTDEDVKRILSKSLYWNEVKRRDNADELLRQELHYEIKEMGYLKLLNILTAYAKKEI